MIEIGIGLILILLLLGAVLWAGGGKTIHEARGSGIIESIPDALEPAPAAPETLGVLSYDLAYGLGQHHPGTSRLDPTTVYDRLDHVVETIAASGADVALLQEVDFASRRTHDIDQLHYIAAALGWGFAARAITWECRYLPYPVWPLGRPTGRLRAGLGVISRYPLVQNTRQRLSQSRLQPLLSPLFSPYHTVQMVDVQCGHQTVRLFNVHLESSDAVTRQRQAQEVVAFVHQMATPASVLMGAFKAVILHASEAGTAPACAPDRAMERLSGGLQGRFQVATDEVLTSSAGLPHSRPHDVLIGSGLHTLERRIIALDEPVSNHLPLVVHLRWALPMVANNRRSNHERL
jgi:endonuclease/exonuclease/phosphatase family metal-dependent hydrolase